MKKLKIEKREEIYKISNRIGELETYKINEYRTTTDFKYLLINRFSKEDYKTELEII